MPDRPTRDVQRMIADHQAARAAATEAEHGYGMAKEPGMSNKPLPISGETDGINLSQIGDGPDAVLKRETDI
ncbi:hypothetical protein [Methylobacterium radiodurans]|nr:hypothetical protein [Methylobacterium radiodurans]